MRSFALSFATFLVFAVAVDAERVEPVFVREAIGMQAPAAPPHLADREPPLATLAAALDEVPGEIAAIQEWNDQGNRPPKNGFTRSTGGALAVRVAPAEASGKRGIGLLAASDRGSLVWGGSIRVADAYRLRIHLKNVVVPPGTTFWVHGQAGSAIAFGNELIDDRGELYTPSVEGELVHLEMELPAGSPGASFDITDFVELVGPLSTHDSPTCLIDATCVTSSTLDVIDLYRRAVAQLQYVKDGSSFVCSGGLLNNSDDSSFVPYLLTANHCFSTQTSATSLEAYWDYKTATCAGAFPSISSSPRSNGSTLLATSPTSDFTFVRMNSVPSGRALLGWDTGALTAGTTLYRISHPFPDDYTRPAPQAYSTSIVTTTSSTCTGASRPYFIYSTMDDGGFYGGSSGSPVILSGGYAVGQLYGACGPDPSAGCNASNRTVDGAFAQTYPLVSGYLGAGNSETCTANTTTACMLNKRFRVKMRYRLGFDTNPPDTDALVKQVTGFANPNFETAFFYFNSQDNIEAMVKILDQGNTNSAGQPTIAVLFGCATPLAIEVTITDTLKGGTRTYTSPFTAMQGGTDFTAFVK
jgi:hypothetical protein